MGLYQKIYEWGTDAKFVPHGKKCDICGKKLAYLVTGFWSVNAKWLADGVICACCHEKLQLLSDYCSSWVPKHLRKTVPFHAIYNNTPYLLKVQEAQEVFESAENFAKEELAAIGPGYTSFFRMKDACFIEATALQVGMKRAKQLNNKLVLFGFVQLGRFEQGGRVLILDGNTRREATVLEAYVYDCEENTLEVNLKAHVGKQQLASWEKGWLILDDVGPAHRHTVVVG